MGSCLMSLWFFISWKSSRSSRRFRSVRSYGKVWRSCGYVGYRGFRGLRRFFFSGLYFRWLLVGVRVR